MRKSLLVLTFLAAGMAYLSPAFAQNNTTEEIMTFETYYPAPYGVYNEMRSKKMAIGDNYYNGSQYCWSPATCSNQIDGVSSPCFPNCNTDLAVEGNVGIGTANPGSKVHVKLGAGIGTVALQASAPNEGVDLQWYDYDDVVSGPFWSGTYKWDLSYRSGSISTPSDNLQLYNSTGVPVTTWTQAGNVGIGTASPQDRIHVEGNATGDGGPGNVEIRVQNTGNAAAMIDLRGGGSGGRSYLIYSSGPGNVIGAGKLAIAAAGRVADLVVDASGNVGIKTTPSSTLHLYEEGASGAHIKLQAASGRGWNILSAGSASGAPAVGNFHIYEDGAPTARFFIQKDTGNVGIGTTGPNSKFQVVDGGNSVSAGTLAAFNSPLSPGWGLVMMSTDDNSASNKYFLIMRTDQNNNGEGINDRFYFRTDGIALADGGAAGGGWSGPADYAEYFETNDTDLDKGELVGIDPNNAKFIKRALGVSVPYLLGVISTKPGFVGVAADDVSDAVAERENSPRWKIVGLLGQIPAKVSLENGPINIGDPLTSSSTPGVAMRATRTGQIVGIALEEFKGEKAEGKILCFINPHTWVAPSEFEELKVRLTKLEAEIGR